VTVYSVVAFNVAYVTPSPCLVHDESKLFKTPVTLRWRPWRLHCVLKFSMIAAGTWPKWKNVHFSSSYYVFTTSLSGSHSV